jgi:3-oxoacyl-[acyl-carrier protein] reductase
MAPLTGKVAIVTGSSRGIGRAVAERLGKDGASVVVNYVRNGDKSREVVSAIEAAGGRALAVRADMSQIADVRRLFQETLDHFGRLDILVNNAGLFQTHSIAEVTEDEFDAAFALNAKGAFFAFQEAARRMGDGGRIINISSCSTAMSLSGFAVYVGSKAAGEQFARALAKELGGAQHHCQHRVPRLHGDRHVAAGSRMEKDGSTDVRSGSTWTGGRHCGCRRVSDQRAGQVDHRA